MSTTHRQHENMQRWILALHYRLDDIFKAIPDFTNQFNTILHHNGAHLAGGIIARTIMQSQLAYVDMHCTNPHTFKESVFFGRNPDIDIYVHQRNCVQFIDQLQILLGNCEHKMHLSPATPPAYDISFMRRNGICARFVMKHEGGTIDVMTCVRDTKDVINGFDISGCSVSWDGRELTVPNISEMRVRSQFRFPKFQWVLHSEYLKAYMADNKFTHARIQKYEALGVHVLIQDNTQCQDTQYQDTHKKCELCESLAAFSFWGNKSASRCYYHSEPSMHRVTNWYGEIILQACIIRRLACCNLKMYGASYQIKQWALSNSDPSKILEICDNSCYVRHVKSIYSMAARTDTGFSAWLLMNDTYTGEKLHAVLKLFREDGPGNMSFPDKMKRLPYFRLTRLLLYLQGKLENDLSQAVSNRVRLPAKFTNIQSCNTIDTVNIFDDWLNTLYHTSYTAHGVRVFPWKKLADITEWFEVILNVSSNFAQYRVISVDNRIHFVYDGTVKIKLYRVPESGRQLYFETLANRLRGVEHKWMSITVNSLKFYK